MAKHSAGPFTVRVKTYSLQPGPMFAVDNGQVYSSRHYSAQAAGRRLATIISGKSTLAKQIRNAIICGESGRYIIETGDGTQFPLNSFRDKFCK